MIDFNSFLSFNNPIFNLLKWSHTSIFLFFVVFGDFLWWKASIIFNFISSLFRIYFFYILFFLLFLMSFFFLNFSCILNKLIFFFHFLLTSLLFYTAISLSVFYIIIITYKSFILVKQNLFNFNFLCKNIFLCVVTLFSLSLMNLQLPDNYHTWNIMTCFTIFIIYLIFRNKNFNYFWDSINSLLGL
jgi:hypothetical protein